MAEETPIDWITEAIKRQSLPKHMREGTVEDFCAKYSITTQSFYYELSKEENKKRILELSLNKAKESVPEILDVLIELAKKGDMRAIDTYLDSVVKLAKSFDLKVDVDLDPVSKKRIDEVIGKYLNGNTGNYKQE